MSFKIVYIVYENGYLWINGTKKRKADEKIIKAIKWYYEKNQKFTFNGKLPETIYGYYHYNDNSFIQDTYSMISHNKLPSGGQREEEKEKTN